ncbi:NAC domain-containing protein [Trifolium repens]|nr:NAC domain-containing protein [Trifolium repens]
MEQGNTSSPQPTSKKRKGLNSENNHDGFPMHPAVLPGTNLVFPMNEDQNMNPAMVYLISEVVIIKVQPGEDITAKVRSFYQQTSEALSVRSANGLISAAVIGNPPMPLKGHYEIITLSGSFAPNEDGIMTVSLASPSGIVVGGRVAGPMIADSSVSVELCRLLRKGNDEPSGLSEGNLIENFNPTEQDLIENFLKRKICGERTTIDFKEIELNNFEPWDLPDMCKVSGKQQTAWFFYTKKDKSYLDGSSSTNRSTKKGSWRTTGKDKEIWKRQTLIGMRKIMTFYEKPLKQKHISEWLIHEYRVAQTTEKDKGWVLCKLFKKERKLTDDKGATSVDKREKNALEELTEASPPLEADTATLDSLVTSLSNPSQIIFDQSIHQQGQEGDLTAALKDLGDADLDWI